MPPRARHSKADDDKPTEKARDADANREGICLRCWPDGWPTEDTNSATCEHGVWSR